MRHQLRMPDLDRAALKILRDVRVIPCRPLKGLSRFTISRRSREAESALGLIVGSVPPYVVDAEPGWNDPSRRAGQEARATLCQN